MLLFEQYGFHGVTVKQIVESVGTSKGGFYHHFSSKDELLFVIHDTFISHVLEKAVNASTTYHSPTTRLRKIINEFVNVFDIYKPHLSVFYQESIYLKPRYEKLVKEKRSQFKQIVKQAIIDGIKCGEFRENLSVDITTMAILGMVNWMYKWYHKSGENTIDEISEIYVDLILHAVLQPAMITHRNNVEL